MRRAILFSIICLSWAAQVEVRAADTEPWNDPFWILLHQPSAVAELDLSPAQEQQFHAVRDDLDLRFLPLRNRSREEALSTATTLVAEAREKMQSLLEPKQQTRFKQLVLQRMGNDALLHEEVANRLNYSATQKTKLEKIDADTQEAVVELRKEMNDEGKDRQAVQQEYVKLLEDQQKKLVAVLTPVQRTALRNVIGEPFRGLKDNQPHIRAPDFGAEGEWINSSLLSLKELRGKVVVVHFYAFGCINCIRNYPWYLEWSERFKDKDVVIVGIHTPETSAERNSDSVRRKAAEAKFDFPVLIDDKKVNWNAWGNSMWPSVYLIDKQGYFREHWAGELKWKGNDGELHMRQKIEELLAE
ncbi:MULTISPECIES: redoxin domain-containing protein [Pirellulaceae]|nr:MULTISPECIES: redoxin domain-containing protein [Pirellulaceae]